jgi:hypothetical protein
MMRRGAGFVAVLVLALAGCGRLGPDEDAPRSLVRDERYVSARDIARYPANSPEAVVLRWWRALQMNDARAAVRLYSRRVRISPRAFRDQRYLGRPFMGGLLTLVEIKDVDRQGREATVFVFRNRVSRAPNGRSDIVSRARGFTTVLERGKWLLADNLYLERAAGYRLAQQAAALGGGGQD